MSRPDPHSFLPLPPADFQLLLILHDGPLHAYGITRRSEESGQVRLEIGSLYRMLARLLENGLIEDLPPDPHATGNDAKRRLYRLTKLGSSVLRAEAQRLRDVVAHAAGRRLVDLPRLP